MWGLFPCQYYKSKELNIQLKERATAQWFSTCFAHTIVPDISGSKGSRSTGAAEKEPLPEILKSCNQSEEQAMQDVQDETTADSTSYTFI